mgnify:CR=1 FL=1
MYYPLLITDRGLAGLPIGSDALERTAEAGLSTGLFSDVLANPGGALPGQAGGLGAGGAAITNIVCVM